MAKRFTGTEKWSKAWFMDLSVKHKVLWMYLCENCDAAGVWEPNLRLATYCVGDQITEDDFKAFGDRVEKLPSGKWWITGFIEFQYGNLSKDCKPHTQIFRLLEKHGLSRRVCKGYEQSLDTISEGYGKGMERLSQGYPKGCQTLKEEEEDKDKEKDLFLEEGCGEKPNPTPEPAAASPKPEEVVAAWNAQPGLPKVQVLSENRRKTLKIRLKDSYFVRHFVEVIAKIAASDFCCGGGPRRWRADFDFFLKPDEPLKVMEGKYDNREPSVKAREFSQPKIDVPTIQIPE